jgi:hypothetical protein
MPKDLSEGRSKFSYDFIILYLIIIICNIVSLFFEQANAFASFPMCKRGKCSLVHLHLLVKLAHLVLLVLRLFKNNFALSDLDFLVEVLAQ